MTGGAGFIGSGVVDALVARGHDVVVLDSLDPAVHPSRPDYLNEGAAYVEADLRDDDALAQALRGVEAVSHQAAMVGVTAGFADAPRYAVVNDVGTALLLRAAIEHGPLAGRRSPGHRAALLPRREVPRSRARRRRRDQLAWSIRRVSTAALM